ncbi:MAG: LEPR-XLL domain-containing protein, partial [Pseudomonadota bacterium]
MGILSWFRPRIRVMSRKMLLEQLEERIVLDAAISATIDNNQLTHDQGGAVEGPDASAPQDCGGAQSAGGAAQCADPLAAIFPSDISRVIITNMPAETVSSATDASTPEAGNDLQVVLISNALAESG